LSPDFDLDCLGLDFASTGFGPRTSKFDFVEQFDGKLFKPYNKRDRLGKMCDFAAAQSTSFVPQRQTIAQQQKQAGAVAESDLVTATEDSEFNVVEQKKNRENEKGDYRRRDKHTMAQYVHKQKLHAQHAEDVVQMKHSMQGPQMTRKRQKWQQQTQRANQAGNLMQNAGPFMKRGMREPSYEVKPEWPTVCEFSKQRQDKLANVTPSEQAVVEEAGQIHAFNMVWEKCRVARPKKIPAMVG